MNTFYKAVSDIQKILIDEPMIARVTYGEIDDTLVNSNGVFPLAHLMTGNVSIQDRIVLMSITVILMDVLNTDESNEQDVLNTQLNIASRLDAVLKRNTLYRNDYELQGQLECEPFTERFDEYTAGYTVSFQIAIKNSMTSC